MGWDQALDLYSKMRARGVTVIDEVKEGLELETFIYTPEYYCEGSSRPSAPVDQEREDLLRDLATTDFGAIDDDFSSSITPEPSFVMFEGSSEDRVYGSPSVVLCEVIPESAQEEYLDIVTERNILIHDSHVQPELATLGCYSPYGARVIASLCYTTYEVRSDRRLTQIDLDSKCAVEDVWREVVRLRKGLSDRIATIELAGFSIPVMITSTYHSAFWMSRDILQELFRSKIDTVFLKDGLPEVVTYILLHAGITVLLSDFRAGLIPVYDTANCVSRMGVWYIRDEWRANLKVLYVDKFITGRLPRFIRGVVKIPDITPITNAAVEAETSGRNWMTWSYIDLTVPLSPLLGCSPSFNAINGVCVLRTRFALAFAMHKVLPSFRDANRNIIQALIRYRTISVTRDPHLNRVATRDLRLLNLHLHALDLLKSTPLPLYRTDIRSVGGGDSYTSTDTE